MSPATQKTLKTILAIVVAVAVIALRQGWLGGKWAPDRSAPPSGSSSGSNDSRDEPSSRTQDPPPNRGTPRGGAYAPASSAPKDAIPGGGLAAHEGVDGGHTLDRHVGRTLAQLKERIEREDKREASTFGDEAAADRFVAQALFDHQADVSRWLASNPSGNEAFPARFRVPAGNVLRRGASDVVAGRSVQVVLAPSRRFREGFRIVTAYVTLP